MPDNLERRFVRGAEPIGQRAPDIGRLVDDMIEQGIFVRRPDIGKLLGLIPQDRLIVFFVIGFEKDRLDLGLLLIWPVCSVKLERAEPLQNGDPATHIRWREIGYRLEIRRHPVFDGPGVTFRGMALERVHLVVDPVDDFGVLVLMRHMIIEDRRRAFRFFGSKYDIFFRRRSASVPSTNPRFLSLKRLTPTCAAKSQHQV